MKPELNLDSPNDLENLDNRNVQRPGEKSGGWFCLPLELREMIYAYAMEDLPHVVVLRAIRRTRQPKFPAVLPSFSFVNKQTYAEVLPVFIRKRQFAIGMQAHMDCFCQFLLRLPNKLGLLNVRSLYLGDWALYLGRWGTAAARILQNCSGLQHLVFEVTDFSATTALNEIGERVAMSKKALASMLGRYFPTWFSSTKLKSVKLICMGKYKSAAHLYEPPTQE